MCMSLVHQSLCLLICELLRNKRFIVELPFCEPGNVWSSKVFAESYRLCVPELESVGWQCAILGQLVGTTKIQDGCRDPDKVQNVFIFTLHHARNITFVCTRMLWGTRNSMDLSSGTHNLYDSAKNLRRPKFRGSLQYSIGWQLDYVLTVGKCEIAGHQNRNPNR